MKRIALALILLAAPATAQACSCAPESLHSLFATLGVVFEGKVDGGPTQVPVISAAAVNARNAYRFKVQRVWKGEVGPLFSVAYPVPPWNTCGVALKDGQTLLVGAYVARQPGQPMEANGCTVMNMNQPSLDYIRDLGAPLRDYRR
jgi:hypothetical protein